MTITIELPDELAAQLAGLPAEEVNRYAVTALEELAAGYGEADPDALEKLRRGYEDIDAGRTSSLEDARSRADAALKAHFGEVSGVA